MRLPSLLAAALLAGAVGGPALAADIGCTSATSDRLYVNVTGVKSSSGLVAVTLYANNPKKFLARHGSLGVARVKAQAGSTKVCVALPAPGQYAAAIYHDVDGDGKVDRTIIGLPSEPFALSNNPPPKMAWPKIGPSLFSTHAGDNTITVRLEKGAKTKAAAADEAPDGPA